MIKVAELSGLGKFILDEIKKRDMTANQFASLVGVSHTTIGRLIEPGDKTLPTLDFLMKLSEATHTDICNLVALVAPRNTLTNARAQVIAERIARLPPDKQEIVDTFLLGLSLKSANEAEKGD